MPCLKPILAYKLLTEKTESGKALIVFSRPAKPHEEVQFSCGQCKPCRLNYAKEWGIRCFHESLRFTDNCFLTLTYNPICLPDNYGLRRKDLTDFMKRVRRNYSGSLSVYNKQTNKIEYPIRFFACGEYGDENSRPHYHTCLFNIDFDDKVFWKLSDSGEKVYVSEKASKLWTRLIKKSKCKLYPDNLIIKGNRRYYLKLGHVYLGEVNFKSACYIARYIMKKITGDKADEHYKRIDEETGEIYKVDPEFITMSRRPGLGRDWIQDYKSDCYPHDYVTIDGKHLQPPKYYDKFMEEVSEEMIKKIKNSRKLKLLEKEDDNTIKRRITKHRVLESKIKNLKRS